MFTIYQERVGPDMTALVTLRDKNLGGNDSMPLVQVRHHYVSNQHESCFQLITGFEFTFDYNRYGTLFVRFDIFFLKYYFSKHGGGCGTMD